MTDPTQPNNLSSEALQQGFGRRPPHYLLRRQFPSQRPQTSVRRMERAGVLAVLLFEGSPLRAADELL